MDHAHTANTEDAAGERSTLGGQRQPDIGTVRENVHHVGSESSLFQQADHRLAAAAVHRSAKYVGLMCHSHVRYQRPPRHLLIGYKHPRVLRKIMRSNEFNILTSYDVLTVTTTKYN